MWALVGKIKFSIQIVINDPFVNFNNVNLFKGTKFRTIKFCYSDTLPQYIKVILLTTLEF